jgi:hypothetical protein
VNKPIHTSCMRRATKIWISLGGSVLLVRGTGEVRFVHTTFIDTIRANGRRKDVPAVLLSRINQLIRSAPANDPRW